MDGAKTVKGYGKEELGEDEGCTPPPVFFVRVASKGLTEALSVRAANNRVKVACFDIVRRYLVRVASKGDAAWYTERCGEEEIARRFFEQPATRDMTDSTMKINECQVLLYI